MKEKIRHLIAEKIIEQGHIKSRMRNLGVVNQLTEEIQNHYLDKLRTPDEEIEILKKVLKELN